MLILADCPADFAWPGLPAGAWTPCDPAQAGDAAAAADVALWRALAPGAAAWRAEVPSPGPPGFWSRLFVVGEAPASQFDALRQALGDGVAPPGPVAALALAGSGFHGHRGRPWIAERGNLHLCAAIRPRALPARDALALVALPAVAVVEALRTPALGGSSAGIKWVNDILLDGRKVAGVLTASQTLDDRVTLALLGIGLNVGVTPPVAATPFVPAVTSLAARGLATTVPEACAATLAALARAWSILEERGAPAVIDAYRDAAVVAGRHVAVWEEGVEGGPDEEPLPPPLAEGVVEAIGDDLSLRLAGRDEAIARGRLALLERPPAGPRRAWATYCSARKRADAGLLPAGERYDSERIREVARRARDEGALMLILSGRFGLLAPANEIPWYDHRLAEEDVATLAAQTAGRLRAMGVDELVWCTADAADDPGAAPYGRAMAEACAQAGVPMLTRLLPGAAE